MKCECCGHKNGTNKRSLPQHRRFFGMIRAYFHHWPERHEFQPDNEEHLRAWALVKAKHRTVTEMTGNAKQCIVTGGSKYNWQIANDGRVWLVSPLSIAFDKLKHSEATALFEDVSGVLEFETGLDAEQLMKEMENAC